MKKIDPRLDSIRKLCPQVQLEISRHVNYMAYMQQPEEEQIPEIRIQVFIQVQNPAEALHVPGVQIRSRFGDLMTAQVTPEALTTLASHPNVVYVECGAPLIATQAVEEDSEQKIEIPYGPLSHTGKGVIVGIIDFGCDFTHGDFINSNGSRMLFFWDQTTEPKGGRRSPYGYSVGVEFTKADLDWAIGHDNPFDALGIDPPPPGAHGTHVMGIAAGNKNEDRNDRDVQVMAPEADIIFVQPNPTDTNIIGGFGDSVNIAEAVKYIFDKASILNRPAVINISFGTNSGPHDGTTLVERWIDRCLDSPGRAVVMALGNIHEEQLARTHSEGQLATGETATLYWQVNPRDETPNEMEIWYSGRDRFVLGVELPVRETGTGPLRELLPIVDSDQSRIFDVGHTGTRVYVSNELHSALNGDNRINIIVISPPDSTIEKGVWRLYLTSRKSREGFFDAWIELDARSRNDNSQSNFIGGSYVRRKTLGSIQSARHAITVSNYSAYTQNLADSTSIGPTRDGRRAPVVAAPGVQIAAANARYRHHPDPDQRKPYIKYTGTSMSAPYTAGLVACMFQKNALLTASQIKGLLAANAKPAPGLDYDYRIDWGYGRCDPIATLEATPMMPTHVPPIITPARCPLTQPHERGPFFLPGAPFTTDLYPDDATGHVLIFTSTVQNSDCEPIANALIQVWHAYAELNGYDMDSFRCRAQMKTDEKGAFQFRTVIPINYQPELTLDWIRAKHIHFELMADGYQPLITEVCFQPDDYLESDWWRRGRESLLATLEEVRDNSTSRLYFKAHFDFVLNRVAKRGYVDIAMQLGLLPANIR